MSPMALRSYSDQIIDPKKADASPISPGNCGYILTKSPKSPPSAK